MKFNLSSDKNLKKIFAEAFSMYLLRPYPPANGVLRFDYDEDSGRIVFGEGKYRAFGNTKEEIEKFLFNTLQMLEHKKDNPFMSVWVNMDKKEKMKLFKKVKKMLNNKSSNSYPELYCIVEDDGYHSYIVKESDQSFKEYFLHNKNIKRKVSDINFICSFKKTDNQITFDIFNSYVVNEILKIS